MKRSRWWLLIIPLASLLVVGAAYASGFVANGDFETGDLTSWTCATCSAGTDDPYMGSYYAHRPTSETLTQTAAVESCSVYRLWFAARAYSAGTHTVSGGFDTCTLEEATYSPPSAGEGWGLFYLTADACEGDSDFVVEFTGTGSEDIDAVTVDCGQAAAASTSAAVYEIGALSDGTPVVISTEATFGDMATFAGLLVVAGLLFIGLVRQVALRR